MGNPDHDDVNINLNTEQMSQTSLDENTNLEDMDINYKIEDKSQTEEITYHNDSDTTIILDDALETVTENITPKIDTDIAKASFNTRASTSIEHVTLEMENRKYKDKNSPSSEDDTVKEKARSPTIEPTKAKPELKKAQMRIRRLSAHEIEEAIKPKKKKKQGVTKTKPKQTAKNTHVSDTLRKDTTGKMPKFTYSSYRLPCKKRKNYTFCCPVSGCKRTFNSIKNWNSHHLSLHRSIR